MTGFLKQAISFFTFYQITDKGVKKINARLFVKRNASTILTCLGGVGVVATSVMAVKETPKAIRLIEEAEKEKGEELTKCEKVKNSKIKLYSFSYCRDSNNNLITSLKYSEQKNPGIINERACPIGSIVQRIQK